MCAKLSILPQPGGLFQQDPAHVRKLEIVYETQAHISDEKQKAADARNRLGKR